jgi:hypothetical protein
MFKRVVVLKLAEGKDPEVAWKHWTEVFAIKVRDTVPGFKKYVLNRVTEPPKEPLNWWPKWWGISEQWFESEEAFIRAGTIFKNLPDLHGDMWYKFMGEKLGDVHMEENVLIDLSISKIQCKVIGIFGLQPDKDPEKAWKYLLDKQSIVKGDTLPGIVRYSIGRVIKTLGEPANWWGLSTLWFDSEKSCARALEMHRKTDDFSHLVDFSVPAAGLAYVQEKVII